MNRVLFKSAGSAVSPELPPASLGKGSLVKALWPEITPAEPCFGWCAQGASTHHATPLLSVLSGKGTVSCKGHTEQMAGMPCILTAVLQSSVAVGPQQQRSNNKIAALSPFEGEGVDMSREGRF